MTVVFDSSAILAIVFEERGAEAVEARRGDAAVSTVSLSECQSKLIDKGFAPRDASDALRVLGLRQIAFAGEQIWRAGALRARYRRAGLSFADCACLALAAEAGLPALTGDQVWADLDHGIPVELFR